MLRIVRLSMIVFVIIGLLASGQTPATVVSVGSGCANLPAGTANFTVQYTASVPAPSGVMATLVTSQNAPLGNAIDNLGNTYPGSITRFNVTGLVFNRIAQINTPVSPGTTVTFPFTLIPAGGMHACAQLFASSDMFIPTTTDVVDGSTGTSSSISVTTPTATTQAFAVIHGSAFTLGAPGTLTTNPNFSNHTSLCSAGNVICLISATREVSTTGTYTYNVGLQNSRDWGAVIATYRRTIPDPIFSSGFE